MICWKILGMSSVVWAASAAPAFAYIDPGTGSIMVQAIIGAVVAAGVFWRTWWSRLTRFFRRGKDDESEPSADTHPGAR